jgi:hypothetical protein
VTLRVRGDEATDLHLGIAARHDGVIGTARRCDAIPFATRDRDDAGVKDRRQCDPGAARDHPHEYL